MAGTCDQSTGECACDSWATGSDCSYLNFKPVDKAKLGYLDPTHTSWGGNAVKSLVDGKWHLYVAEIACSEASSKTTRCGLSSWKTQSQVAHAVADHPAGPYVRQGRILPTEHHNPTVQISPVDGKSWNLYSISDWDGPIVVVTSTDQGQSWSSSGGASEQTVLPYNNPGPVLNTDGSMVMYVR